MLVEVIFPLPGPSKAEMLTEPFPPLRAIKCLAPKWVLQCLIKVEHACSLLLSSSNNMTAHFLFHLLP